MKINYTCHKKLINLVNYATLENTKDGDFLSITDEEEEVAKNYLFELKDIQLMSGGIGVKWKKYYSDTDYCFGWSGICVIIDREKGLELIKNGAIINNPEK